MIRVKLKRWGFGIIAITSIVGIGVLVSVLNTNIVFSSLIGFAIVLFLAGAAVGAFAMVMLIVLGLIETYERHTKDTLFLPNADMGDGADTKPPSIQSEPHYVRESYWTDYPDGVDDIAENDLPWTPSKRDTDGTE